MTGTRRNPYQVNQSGPSNPNEPESDIGETVAWCDTCGDERRFVRERQTEDAAREEMESPEPDVRRALRGDVGWRCVVCGTFVPNLVSEEGYDFEYSDVGYRKKQFEDDQQTVRDPSTETVSPPAAAEATRVPHEDREDTKRPEE